MKKLFSALFLLLSLTSRSSVAQVGPTEPWGPVMLAVDQGPTPILCNSMASGPPVFCGTQMYWPSHTIGITTDCTKAGCSCNYGYQGAVTDHCTGEAVNCVVIDCWP
jgi:hypothetical protein